MSHLKERSEKKCLNCGSVIHGRYCHVCGQENLEPEETTWHLVTHFFNDITHFDGKFFVTLKDLLFKPGFLSREYKAGRRSSYLNPVRMYIFTSALFFLVFFSVTGFQDVVNTTYDGKTMEDIQKMDSLQFISFLHAYDSTLHMSKKEFPVYADSVRDTKGLHFSTEHYKSKAEYDSLLKTGKVDDGWLEQLFTYKEIEMNQKYHNDQRQISKAFVNNLLHSFPQILFISLPIFAFILKLLYNRRKQFYYVSHAIFSIHLYVFVFMMMFIMLLLRKLHGWFKWEAINYIGWVVILLIFFYLYKAMRNFYQQRRGKTILKFVLLNLSMLVVLGILFAIFIFFSLLKV